MSPSLRSSFRRRRSGSQPGALVVFAAWSFLATGCVASTVPPALSADQLSRIEASDALAIAVGVDAPRIDTGVEKYALLRESDRIIRALRKTGIFQTVDYTHRFGTPPELRAAVSLVERTAVYRPYFSVLTLGLFPACASEVRGYSFSMKSPQTGKSLDFDYTFKGHRCGGWFPFLFNLSPRWSFVFPEERLDQRLKLELVSKIDRIRELAYPDTD